MNVTVHQRPGVYSAYDASSVVSGSGAGKQVGLVAVNAKAAANEVKIVTSYDGAVNAFGQGTMAELIRLALKNGAGSVAAVPIAGGEGYADGFAALEGLEDITAVICDSTDGDVQKAMKQSVETASANRRERIAVAAGGAEETVDELIARAKALNHERVVLVAPGGTDEEGKAVSGLSLAAAVAGAIAGTTDPALPLGGEGDGPRALPPGGDHVPVGEAAGDHRDELGRPGRLPPQVLQQQAIAPGVVQLRAAIAGGVYPRRPVQCVHAQAGVVGDGGQAAGLHHGLGLQQGVLLEGGARLLYVHIHPGLGLGADLYPQFRQDGVHFRQLLFVFAGQYQFHVFPPQRSAARSRARLRKVRARSVETMAMSMM